MCSIPTKSWDCRSESNSHRGFVDYFRRIHAEHRDSQHKIALAVRDHLDDAPRVAHSLRARDLVHLYGSTGASVAALDGLLLSQSDHSGLGIGEDRARDHSVVYFVMLARERVERRNSTVLGADRGRHLALCVGTDNVAR